MSCAANSTSPFEIRFSQSKARLNARNNFRSMCFDHSLKNSQNLESKKIPCGGRDSMIVVPNVQTGKKVASGFFAK